MSSFTDYLTVEGERLLANAAAGKATITFTKVVMGSGYMPSGTNAKNMTGVVTPVKELDIKSVSLNDSTSVVISSYFNNETIEEGFYFREKGIYMSDGDEEILGIYGNAGSTAEFIDTAAVCTIEKTIRTVINMTSDEVANITLVTGTEARAPIIIDGITLTEFVKTETAKTIEDGQMVILNDIVYIFTGGDSSDTANYTPGMKLSDVYKAAIEGANANGGIAASQNALHEAYAEVMQEIEDISTSDASSMTTEFSETSKLEKLVSGEMLKVMFGKVAKAVSSLIDHIATKATASVLGHVKLSDSTAITDSTGLALPATEKNASISGTLANMIDTIKSNLSNVGTLYTNSKSNITVGTTNTLLASKSLPAGSYIIIAEFYVPTGYTGEMNCFVTTASASGTCIGTTRIRKSESGSSCRIQTSAIATFNATTNACAAGKLDSSFAGCEGVLRAVRVK